MGAMFFEGAIAKPPATPFRAMIIAGVKLVAFRNIPLDEGKFRPPKDFLVDEFPSRPDGNYIGGNAFLHKGAF